MTQAELKWIISRFNLNRRSLLSVFFLSILLASVQSLSPLFLATTLSSYHLYGINNRFVFYFLAMLGNFILIMVFGYWNSITYRKFVISVELKLRQDAFDRIQNYPMRVHQQLEVGRTLSLVTTEISLFSNAVSALKPILTSLITMIIISLLILARDFQIGSIFFVIMVIYYLTNHFYSKKIIDIRNTTSEELAKYTEYIQNIMPNLGLLKIHNTGDNEFRQFCQYLDQWKTNQVKEEKFAAFYPPTLLLIISLSLLLVFSIVKSVGFVLLLELVGFILMVFNQDRTNSQTFPNLYAGYNNAHRIYAIFSDDNELDTKRGQIEDNEINWKGKLELNEITYKSKNHHILNKINLAIDQHENIAIIGPTGSGKSTLLNIIAGLYQPDSGKISIDGISFNDIASTSIRKHITIVEQSPIILNSTVAQNIDFQNNGISKEKMADIINEVELNDIISPDFGIDVPTGEDGSKLSGGQKQRISLARAFLTNPDIFLVDDGFSSLDTFTANKILSNIMRFCQHRKLVVVTNNINTIREMDKIILMKHGNIDFVGSHEELMAFEPIYRKIIRVKNMEVSSE